MRTFVALGLSLLLAAGSSGAGAQETGQARITASEPTTGATPADAAAKSAATSDYRLGPADKVRVIVFNEPTLTGEYLVNANGNISFPLIGDVPAQGRTTSQVLAAIQQGLSNGYLRDPKVSIDVLSFRPFYILGEVNKPGEYPYSTGLTVLNAVATAQGFTYRANKKRVFIRHQDEKGEASEPLTTDLLVRPGDTIRIRERYF